MYGLIGYPLGHSFSAEYFNNKFRSEGKDESYHLFPLEDIAQFESLLANSPELKGLNVTIPYKEKVIGYLDGMSDDAKEIGAVNVVKIDSKGEKTGYNSDAEGFRRSILPLLESHMTKALVLGTGGASKAVKYVLKKLGLDVLSVSRIPREGGITYSDLNEEIVKTHHVVVNTTPLGMWPDVDKAPAFPYEFLTSGHLCFDLVYNPVTTRFMELSAQNGAKVKNGLEMLYAQAERAWEIWNE